MSEHIELEEEEFDARFNGQTIRRLIGLLRPYTLWVVGFLITVMMVSGGYPGNYAKGKFIQGLQTTAPGTMIFHAGTKPHGDEVVTDGGRVLTATGLGGDVHEARKLAYRALEGISLEHSYFRRDIGVDLQQTGGR